MPCQPRPAEVGPVTTHVHIASDKGDRVDAGFKGPAVSIWTIPEVNMHTDFVCKGVGVESSAQMRALK
jgi:hypothetical protein